jgi:signal transduction histidine kinase/class 3 adenylate cyclase/CheY-like chemotaxis protein
LIYLKACSLFRVLLVLSAVLPAMQSLNGQQERRNGELGQSLIRSYGSRDYGAGTQNWAVLQDTRGIIYVGNNECLLEFDGHEWQRVEGATGGAFSLATDAGGVVYVGGAGEFGFLQSNAGGRRQFVSLLGKLSPTDRDFGVIRSVHILGDTVFFQSRQTLLMLHQGQVQVLRIPDAYLRAYAIGGQYLLKLAGKGLCVWRDNAFRELPGSRQFDTETISFILPHYSGKLLIGTRKNGIWLYDTVSGNRTRPPEFQYLMDRWRSEELYHGISLPEGNFALATLSGGVYVVGKDGSLLRHIDRSLGLSDNTVHYLFLDKQQGLWTALNQGLNRISLYAPFEYWDAALGLDAAVLCIKRHEGVLYAGTNLGLYKMAPAADGWSPARFVRVGAFRDQVFSLETISPPGISRSMLLLATGSGVYALENDGQLSRIHVDNLGPVYALEVSRSDPSVLFAGGDKGLYRFRNAAGGWARPQLITDKNLLVRAVREDNKGRIWAGFRNRGFGKIEPDPGGGYRITHFDSLPGKPLVGDQKIFRWGDELIFRSSLYGSYRFDATRSTFVRFRFDETANTPDPPVWFAATGPGRHVWLWAPSPAGLHLEWRRETREGKWDIVSHPFEMLPDTRDLFQGGIYQENENLAWMGGATRLYRFDAGATPDSTLYSGGFPVLLRYVRAGADSVYAYDWHQDLLPPPELPFRDNSMQFRFAAPDFEKPENTRYSYCLEGYDQKWSAWTERSEKEYTNLPPGTYRFVVRAKNPFAGDKTGAGFTFTILRPWYQTWWAYLLYLLMTGLLIYTIARLLTRQQAQRLQNEQLLNERLRLADKLKDQFLANTSHELRTPLNGIIGLSESLLDGVGKFSEEKQREELSLVITSGKRLSGLVNDLLDFAKLREKDLQLRTTSLDFRALTDVVLQICRPLVQDKDVSLENMVPDTLPPVFADEDRLQQVLLNLVGNAIKFTAHGHVRVGARASAAAPAPGGKTVDMIEVFVEDTGIGIARDKQQHIFEAFEQADGSIEREFGGTGLGLAISKSLIELHGGSIWVKSEPGAGASFFFTLPLAAEDAPVVARTDLARALAFPEQSQSLMPRVSHSDLPDLGANPVTVLIVDDEPINHHVLSNHLESGNFRIVVAWNGEEALAILASRSDINLVLLDVMMPRMNGYEVCRRIREKYLPSELPVIMVTAKNQVADLVQGLSLGANDYIAKPFSKEELLARVKTQIDLLRIYSVAERFVPGEFIRALGHERITEVALGDQTQRDVTVFFTDIRDYTALSEQMTPEDNFRFVNAFNSRMGPAIRQHEGFINQYLGDGIMAIFPQKPEDALHAAILMQQVISNYNTERTLKHWKPIKVGMGLHTGPLIMGITGDEKRLDAATISDAVNTASRIENLTKYYSVKILLSENTVHQIHDISPFSLRYLGEVQVKGKQRAVGIYECFDADPEPLLEKKRATLDLFSDGIRHYLAGEFDAASRALRKVVQQNPDDFTALLFLGKIDGFIRNGIPNDWTGVEKMA